MIFVFNFYEREPDAEVTRVFQFEITEGGMWHNGLKTHGRAIGKFGNARNK